VNDEALVRAEDERGRRGFEAIGFAVDTTSGGADALFDNVLAMELVPR
jgi:hypothetical protein